MIAKKNPKVNLERKRILFFNLGLLAAGSFTLAAFTYTTPLERLSERYEIKSTEITYQAEAIELPKPEETPVVNPQVPTGPSDPSSPGDPSGPSEFSSAGSNTNTNPTSGVGSLLPPGNGGFFNRNLGTVTTENDIVIPKIEAAFPGGYAAMQKFITENMEIPEIDRIEGNQGRMFVQFIVEKDGSISNVEVVKERSLSPTLDREAKRLVKSFPTWSPGKDEYGPVRTRVHLPLTITLE